MSKVTKVRSHIRRTKSGKETVVREHTRKTSKLYVVGYKEGYQTLMGTTLFEGVIVRSIKEAEEVIKNFSEIYGAKYYTIYELKKVKKIKVK